MWHRYPQAGGPVAGQNTGWKPVPHFFNGLVGKLSVACVRRLRAIAQAEACGSGREGGWPTAPSTRFVYTRCIRIKDDSTDGSHGDNNGRIAVIGCLSHDINICIDGDNNGTVSLIQTGCFPTYVDTCPSTPCGE